MDTLKELLMWCQDKSLEHMVLAKHSLITEEEATFHRIRSNVYDLVIDKIKRLQDKNGGIL